MVNLDDEYGQRLASEFDCLTYSAEGSAADYTAVGREFRRLRRQLHWSSPSMAT